VSFPTPRPKQRFRFRVRIPGSSQAGAPAAPITAFFRSAGPLRLTIAKGERRVGGSPVPFTWPMGVNTADITLRAGSTNDMGLFNWAVEAAQAAAGKASKASDFQRDIAIDELGRGFNTAAVPLPFLGGVQVAASRVVNTWLLTGAWPVDYAASEDYDGESDEYLIQSLVLTYDGIRCVHPQVRGEARSTDFLVSRV
jgi:phage tail-like protein